MPDDRKRYGPQTAQEYAEILMRLLGMQPKELGFLKAPEDQKRYGPQYLGEQPSAPQPSEAIPWRQPQGPMGQPAQAMMAMPNLSPAPQQQQQSWQPPQGPMGPQAQAMMNPQAWESYQQPPNFAGVPFGSGNPVRGALGIGSDFFAAPGVAQAMLAQPSQSAASYTPGRAAIEGAAPTRSGANPLASEPWPEINPLAMEPQPERTEQKDFEIADLLKFVGSPQEPEATEKKGGMSTAAKMALGLGGLGLILALRNQYQKDKGTLGRNTSNMLGMVGRGLGGYAMYHQGEERQKMQQDELSANVMIEIEKMKARDEENKQKAQIEQNKLDAAKERTQIIQQVRQDIATAARADRNYWNQKNYELDASRPTGGELGPYSTAGERMLVLKNKMKNAMIERANGGITSDEDLDPMLPEYGVTVSTLDKDIAKEARAARVQEQLETIRTLGIPLTATIASSILRGENFDPSQYSAFPMLKDWLAAKASPSTGNVTEE